ncbi:MAG: hypothetical protein ABR562_03050 [Thermoplasmatota archaeon]
MGVAIPRDNEDRLRLQLQVLPGKATQDIFLTIPDPTKTEALRRLTVQFLEATSMRHVPVFGQGPDGKLAVMFAMILHHDAGFTKGRLLDAILEMKNLFLYWDLASVAIFKEYGSHSDPLVGP